MTTNNETNAPQPSLDVKVLFPIAMIGLIDAIAFMIVAPSLIFYVLQVGGTHQQYGIILSAFSLSSFLFKPILGVWSDKSGGLYRKPYLVSIAISSFGGLLYFLAASATRNDTAIYIILLARLCNGVGGANNTLGFAYIARVLPQQVMTRAMAVLSMVQIAGMTLGPAINGLLDAIHVEMRMGTRTITIDPLNSVGLVIMIGDLTSMLVIYFMLKEPVNDHDDDASKQTVKPSIGWMFWKNLMRMDILVPTSVIFTMNMNFQLIETALAPAAHDGLGLSPVGISLLFGLNTLIIFFAILLTFQLSALGVQDTAMIFFGLVVSVFGYGSMYIWWKRDVQVWAFVIPLVLSCVPFPFLGGPSRSFFTHNVKKNVHLKEHMGTMQAILSMASSIPGFVAPGIITAFILRTPELVDQSTDEREFSYGALFAPTLSLLSWFGLLYILFCSPVSTEASSEDDNEEYSEAAIDERLALLSRMTDGPDPAMEANKRQTTLLMHIPQVSFHPTDYQSTSVTRQTALF